MLLNPHLLTLKEILESPLPPVEWDCQPIIPHQRRVIIFGEFGALKSWVLLHLGLHLASGQLWLGKFAIPFPRSVLYIDEEMAEEDLRRRIKQLAGGMESGDSPIEFRAYSRVGITFDRAGARRLQLCLKRESYQPTVIIVESLIRVLEGSENFAWDVAAFWRNVEPILAGGSTLIVSHHMSKSDPSQEGPPRPLRLRARGSSEIIAGSDVAWAVEIVKEGESSKLSCVKTRSSATPKPFTLRIRESARSVTLEIATSPSQKQGVNQLSELLDQPISP